MADGPLSVEEQERLSAFKEQSQLLERVAKSFSAVFDPLKVNSKLVMAVERSKAIKMQFGGGYHPDFEGEVYGDYFDRKSDYTREDVEKGIPSFSLHELRDGERIIVSSWPVAPNNEWITRIKDVFRIYPSGSFEHSIQEKGSRDWHTQDRRYIGSVKDSLERVGTDNQISQSLTKLENISKRIVASYPE